MSKFVDSLLLNSRLRRNDRVDQLDDHLLADIGVSRREFRRPQPFLFGALVGRTG